MFNSAFTRHTSLNRFSPKRAEKKFATALEKNGHSVGTQRLQTIIGVEDANRPTLLAAFSAHPPMIIVSPQLEYNDNAMICGARLCLL
jgi:hypothetical protein